MHLTTHHSSRMSVRWSRSEGHICSGMASSEMTATIRLVISDSAHAGFDLYVIWYASNMLATIALTLETSHP